MTTNNLLQATLPSGKTISRLGFGCSSAWASRVISNATAADCLAVARNGGINYFDTGPTYGNGRAEKRLGRLVQSENRDRLIISSKTGSRLEGVRLVKDFTPGFVTSSVLESLERLQTDYLDLLFLHGPEKNNITDELKNTLYILKRKGIVHLVGINSFDVEVIESIDDDVFDAFMPEYNITNSTAATLISRLGERGKIVISATALAQTSFLPPAFSIKPASVWYDLRHMKRKRRRPFQRTSDFCPSESQAITIREALTFSLSNRDIHSSVFGSASPQHIDSNIMIAHDIMEGLDLNSAVAPKTGCPTNKQPED